jgi:predicted nucleotidyltransferase
MVAHRAFHLPDDAALNDFALWLGLPSPPPLMRWRGGLSLLMGGSSPLFRRPDRDAGGAPRSAATRDSRGLLKRGPDGGWRSEAGSSSIEVMETQQRLGMSPELRQKLEAAALATSGLGLLVLFGSRGRGDNHPGSDWDFAIRGDDSLDIGILSADLAAIVATDRTDLVDLDRAGGLLRYQVARDGMPLYEAHPHAFEQFWLDAVSFWCDAQRILESEYDAILKRTSG